MTRYHAGIDPGLDGAIALFDHTSNTIVTVFDMPTFTVTVNKKQKKRLDLYGIARFFDLHAGDIVKATIEDPNSMPEQGIASAFNFGHNCGVAQMAVAAHLIPMQLVKPAQWKSVFKLSKDKDASRRAVTLLFPQDSAMFARKGDDGRAEAVLLAMYGAMFR